MDRGKVSGSQKQASNLQVVNVSTFLRRFGTSFFDNHSVVRAQELSLLSVKTKKVPHCRRCNLANVSGLVTTSAATFFFFFFFFFFWILCTFDPFFFVHFTTCMPLDQSPAVPGCGGGLGLHRQSSLAPWLCSQILIK